MTSNSNKSAKPISNSKTQLHTRNITKVAARHPTALITKRRPSLKGIDRTRFFNKLVSQINNICNQPSEQYWRVIRRTGTGDSFSIFDVDGKPLNSNDAIAEKLRRQRNHCATMQRTQQWCKGAARTVQGVQRNSRKKKRSTKKDDRARKEEPPTSESVKNEIYLVEFPDTSECTLDAMSSLDSIILHSDFDRDSEIADRINDIHSWHDRPSQSTTEPVDEIQIRNSHERPRENALADPRRSRRWKRPVIPAQKCAFCQVVLGDIAFLNGTQQLCWECAERHFESVTQSRLQKQSIGYKEYKAVSGDTVYSAR